jgi:DNA-binding NtrC family response regulator
MRAGGAWGSSIPNRLLAASKRRSCAEVAEVNKLRGLAFELTWLGYFDSGTALASQAFVMDHQNHQTLSARSASGANGDPTRAPLAKPSDQLEKPGVSPGRRSVDPVEFERFLEHAAGLDAGQSQSLRSWLELAEAWQITKVLRSCRGNRSATARELGIGRRTLYAKMDKLGITASWGV